MDSGKLHHSPQIVNDIEAYRTALPMDQVLVALGVNANGNHMILCPSHSEETASCKVYPDHLYCFGCGAHFDCIGIVRQILCCDFWSAVNWIADQAGLPRAERSPEAQARYQESVDRSATLETIFQDAQKHDEQAIRYLINRKVSPIVAGGRVGYLPPNYQPPDPEAAKRVGLYSRQGNFLFAGRIVIPIFHQGRVVSLYGRALDDDRIPKHVYPASTDSEPPTTLWNLETCHNEKEAFLAEGIIDALSLIARGFKNTVALFGTQGLTKARLETLKRTKIEKVILVFDSDSNHSGQAAALKTGEKLFRACYQVEIVTLPLVVGQEKCDPNSYFRDHGADDFLALPRRDFFQSFCEQIPQTGTIQEKAKAARPVLRLVANLNDELLDKGLLKQIRERCPDFTLEALEKRLRDTRRTSSDVLPVGSDFLPDLYADSILEQDHVIHYHGAFFFWADGVYRERSDLEVKRVIQQLGRGLLRKAHIEDAVHSLMIKTYVRPEVVNRPGICNLSNGHIDLMTDNPELLPHTPGLLSTIQLPIRFDDQADCPEFQRFFSQKVPDSSLQSLVQEIIGYLLVPDTSYQKGFIFQGDTGTGKSTLIHIIANLIGRENHSAIALERLGERFKTANIDGKLVNLSSETTVKEYVSDGVVKAIIAGDEIEVEKKHQQSYMVRPYCRLVSACNDLPLSHDTHDAFFRRWAVVPFDEKLDPADYDRKLKDRICANELSGVLLWALAGLARLRTNGAFTVSQASQEKLEKWKRDLDPVREFAHRFFKEDVESKILLQTLFKSYNEWCKKTNRQSYFTDSNLKERLEKAGFVFKKTNQGQALMGYWFAYDPDTAE